MKPAILRLAEEGRVRFFIQFGGQAGAWLSELQRAYNGAPAVRPWLAAAADALAADALSDESLSSGCVTQGVDIKSWILDPKSAPNEVYLSSSAISQPCIFLTQVANVIAASLNGLEINELLKSCVGLSGHSQGIMPSVLFSMELEGDTFTKAVVDMTRWFFWQGIRMQQAFPIYNLEPNLVEMSVKEGFGEPSPMLSLTGAKFKELEELIKGSPVSISLRNTYDKAVLSGPPEDLLLFAKKMSCSAVQFIFTSAPFHSPYMKSALEQTMLDIKKMGIDFKAGALKVPVYATDTGKNLQQSDDLTRDLLTMMHIKPVDWPLVMSRLYKITDMESVTHVIDFGPGDIAAKLSHFNTQGRGIEVVSFSSEDGRLQLFSANSSDVKFGQDWNVFRPKFAQSQSGDDLIFNKFTEYTGYQPIFGGGMTPTTMEPDIVVAAANAGFIVELAGGGQVTEDIFRSRMEEVAKKIDPRRGIIINTLFLDPYLWSLHSELIPALKMEGYPIIGVTVSAGVPEKDKAVSILERFYKAGIWCNSFKVGTDAQIEQALEIAESLTNSSTIKIILQIEGGKGGGHHSWEDLNDLLLRSYAKVRKHDNVILCAGGGIWNEGQAWNYLNGNWHKIDEFHLMPVDAVFIGTRLMAVKEAKTSIQVKKLLVGIKGTEGWIGKGKILGGITSGESSLGADIYYAENQAAQTGRFLDSFCGDRDKILAHKKKIIDALNKTCKPYFGDLETMTYAQVLARMKELMAPGDIANHIPHDGEWYDASYRWRYDEFAKRAGQRHAETALLHPEDIDYFLWLCRRPGKPVNFVPIIDEDIRRWFKSDSLWQAHDPNCPADAVFTMPGPLSVQGIQKIDEPVAEVLGGFAEYIAKRLSNCAAVMPCCSAAVNSSTIQQQDSKTIYETLWGKNKKTKIEIKIEREDIRRYVASVGEKSKIFTHGKDGRLAAPLNMAFVFVWEPVTAVLWRHLKETNLLKLVHLSNKVLSCQNGNSLVFEGDTIQCEARLHGVKNTKTGTVISVLSDIKRDNELVVEVESRFFVRMHNMAGHPELPDDESDFCILATPREFFADVFHSPINSMAYAAVSNDHNPIHLDINVARKAGFDSPIIHGMWTASAALSILNKYIGNPLRVVLWNVKFEAPVFANEELKILSHHTANHKGSKIIEVRLANSKGITVMRGTAHVRQRHTAYVFTGQGSQEQGMGLSSYQKSAAARKVWDEADAYCKSEFGFSILKIVRENPKEVFVNGEILRHPKGVLHLTQFTQVALTVVAMAHVAELKEAHLNVDDAIFCGHSLGEYAALSCSGIIPFKDVIKTVYRRGLTMQNYVPRDKNGVSPYGMCVVRPNIVKMSHEELELLIKEIAGNKGSLEIVNYNIEGEQYSVTGDVLLLKRLEEQLRKKEAKTGATKPSVIFLNGIDVPFHSTVLRPGVAEFRKTLEGAIPKSLEPSLLVDRYIPNLNARPFELNKDYIEEVFNLTGSPVLKDTIAKGPIPALEDSNGLSRTLLIELLSYQFASPVQWIKTQEVLMQKAQRIIEIGPRPVLSNMIKRTLAKAKNKLRGPQVLHVLEDRKAVFYE